jgi:hypothetical protein
LRYFFRGIACRGMSGDPVPVSAEELGQRGRISPRRGYFPLLGNHPAPRAKNAENS